MESPERDPTIAQNDRGQDAASLEQKAVGPRRAWGQESVGGLRIEVRE